MPAPQVRTQSVPLGDTCRDLRYAVGAGSCCQPLLVRWNIGVLPAARNCIHVVPPITAASRSTSTIAGPSSTRIIEVFSGLESNKLGCIEGNPRYPDISDKHAPSFSHIADPHVAHRLSVPRRGSARRLLVTIRIPKHPNECRCAAVREL